MPMSMQKVDEVLASKGFVIRRYYTLDEYCIYLEVFSVRDASTFMLYVSSRYELKIPFGLTENVYPLKYMDMDNIDTTNYTEEPDKVEMEQFYNHFDIDFDGGTGNEDDLEKRLKENYNYEVTLKDLKRDDLSSLKEIFRQLKRFLFCVKNIKYKISIFYKNYLCSITKDDELDAFLIMNFPKVEEHKLYIYLDLKTMFEKMSTFPADIKSVKDGLHRLLDQNQIKHTKVLNEMIQQRVTILSISDTIATKKTEILEACKEFEKLLVKLNQSEVETCTKLTETHAKYSDFGLQGLHSDIERTHIVSKLEGELKKITAVKREILDNIFNLRSKYENMSLKMDKILFDNSIMIHEISKNFEKLSHLVSK
jgi:hypothetical protein